MYNRIIGSFVFLLFLASSALAEVDLAEVEKWSAVKSSTYEHISKEDHSALYDRIKVENDTYIIIWQSAGNSCPAGYFFLANKKKKNYIGVDSGTCNEELKIELTDTALTFKAEGEITAKYPLYP